MPSRSLLRFLRAQTEDSVLVGSLCSPRINRLPRSKVSPIASPSIAVTTPRRAFSSRAHTTSSSSTRLSPLCLSSDGSWRPSPRCRHAPGSGIDHTAFLRTSARHNDKIDDHTTPEPRTLTWQERLWGTSASRGDPQLKPGDLPCRDDIDSDAILRRTLSAKAAIEPRLRCTEVDENGETTITDGEFKKTELIAKVGRRLSMPLRFLKCVL